MTHAVYVSVNPINKLQTDVMHFMKWWAVEKKTTVPLQEIVKKMQENGVKKPATSYAIGALLSKGYIRRAVTISNKSSYVMIRSIE